MRPLFYAFVASLLLAGPALAQAPHPAPVAPARHDDLMATGATPKAHHARRKLTPAQRRLECLRRYRIGRPKFNPRHRKWPAYYALCDARLRREQAGAGRHREMERREHEKRPMAPAAPHPAKK